MPYVKVGEIRNKIKDVACRPYTVKRMGDGYVRIEGNTALSPTCQYDIWNALSDYSRKYKGVHEIVGDGHDFFIDIKEPFPEEPE